MSCETLNAHILNILFIFNLTHFFSLIAYKEKQRLRKSSLLENFGKWCKGRKAGLLDHYWAHLFASHEKLLDFIWWSWRAALTRDTFDRFCWVNAANSQSHAAVPWTHEYLKHHVIHWTGCLELKKIKSCCPDLHHDIPFFLPVLIFMFDLKKILIITYTG